MTIQEETVPLAELPTEAFPQEPVSIPEDEVPLAAPSKDRTECWKRDRAVCICYCVRRSRFLWKENKRRLRKKILKINRIPAFGEKSHSRDFFA